MEMDQPILPDLETGEIGYQGAPTVARDLVIIGAAFREGGSPKSYRNNKGDIRGFDLRTGVRKWHYQLVRHPIWDFDVAAAPILADITVGGKAIKSVALPTNGGSNWPGGSYDPETHMLYLSATNASPSALGLVVPAKGVSDMDYIRGFAPGAGRGGFTVQGLPLLNPPYGTITAIDLDKGDIVRQVPHGETPDAVRNHEALKGVTVPRTGQSGSVGTLVTKTLVIGGDPEVTTVAPRPRGAVLRAYDKATGKEVGGVNLPAPQSGSPMTYTVGGRQYIVVAVSGGPYSGEYIAFRLPAPSTRGCKGRLRSAACVSPGCSARSSSCRSGPVSRPRPPHTPHPVRHRVIGPRGTACSPPSRPGAGKPPTRSRARAVTWRRSPVAMKPANSPAARS
jgi:hypothetical protein